MIVLFEVIDKFFQDNFLALYSADISWVAFDVIVVPGKKTFLLSFIAFIYELPILQNVHGDKTSVFFVHLMKCSVNNLLTGIGHMRLRKYEN